MLKCLNIVFTSMFSMECVLKIIAFGVLVRALTSFLPVGGLHFVPPVLDNFWELKVWIWEFFES